MPRPKPRLVVESREELVRLYAEVCQEHGPRVTVKKFVWLAGISEPVICRFFDSFGDLREAVGLERRIKLLPWYTKEELLEELHKVVVMLGRLPSCFEFSKYARCRVQRLFHRFGSYREAVGAYRKWLQRQRERGPAVDEPVRNPQQPAEDPMLTIRWMEREWFGMRVGFKVASSDFRGVPADVIDVLVVLRHDWPACPVPVVEFGKVCRKPTAEM